MSGDRPAAVDRSAERELRGTAALRAQIVATCRSLNRLGLSQGTSGNVSTRCGTRRFLMSPSGVEYDTLAAEDIALVELGGRWFGRRRPSTEWRFHRDIFRQRPEVGAVVHTHSRWATSLACTGRDIPAFHYMVAVAGGSNIRCAPYHTFGSQALADAAVEALLDRKACLLANHGVIALGSDLRGALALAGEVESLAAQYCTALALGRVRLLDELEMCRVVQKFQTYGRDDATDPDLIFAGNDPRTDPGDTA